MHRGTIILYVIKNKTTLFLHIKGAQYLALSAENGSIYCRRQINTLIAARGAFMHDSSSAEATGSV